MLVRSHLLVLAQCGVLHTTHKRKTGFHVQSKQQSRNIECTLYDVHSDYYYYIVRFVCCVFAYTSWITSKWKTQNRFRSKRWREKKKNNIENIVFTTLRLRLSQSGAFASTHENCIGYEKTVLFCTHSIWRWRRRLRVLYEIICMRLT